MKPYLIVIMVLCSAISALSAAAETSAPPGITLGLELGKNRSFPGETVPVTVTLRVKGVSIRNIDYPRLAQPGGGQISFAPPTQGSDNDDTATATYRFLGWVAAGQQGIGKIGPATLDCELMEQATGSAAFFGESIPRTVRVSSPVAQLQILPLPEAGRPASFSGAIGNFSMTVTTKPESVAVGDPLTVTTTISGTGTFSNASCPTITGTGLQSFPVRSTRADGRLSCEQVIVPKDRLPLPSIIWSYFDPEKEAYKTLSRPIHAAFKNEEAASKTSTAKPASAAFRESTSRNNFLTPLKTITVTVITLFMVISGGAIVIRKRVAQCPVHPDLKVQQMIIEADKVLNSGDVEKFYTMIFGILQLIVAGKTNQHPHAISGIMGIPHIENPIGVNLATLFQRCNMVRYGQCLPDCDGMNADLNLLKWVISNLNNE